MSIVMGLAPLAGESRSDGFAQQLNDLSMLNEIEFWLRIATFVRTALLRGHLEFLI